MSSLEKLAIRGIRSFDHNDLSVMQFYSPLTVIVGANGSGKTTIIECLKYATTGDLPPNTKGGAFVHDPNIAGVSEVKASVKLRFYNTKKEKMMVERRLQVTKKKTGVGLTMKTLEGVISYADENVDASKRQTISTKCAQLDSEVPLQLGVSKAILENVIFCHQEESNWPLSEPAALKKKFDDIFEATKYTKALDAIKTLRKEQAVELRVDNQKLTAARADRDRSKKLKDQMAATQKEIDLKQIEHEALDIKIKGMNAKNKTFYEQAVQHKEILNKADTLETKRRIIEDNLAQLRSSMKQLSLTDQELQDQSANFDNILNDVRAARDTDRKVLDDEQDALIAAERKLTFAHTQQGTLLAQKDRYESNLETRQSLIHRISKEHAIPGYEHDLSEAEVAEFQAKLEELSSVQRGKIETLKAEARKVETGLQESLQNLKSADAADKRTRNAIADQIRTLNTRMNQYVSQLESYSVSESTIAFSEKDLEVERKRKLDLEAAAAKEDLPAQISAKEAELRGLEEGRERLHERLTALNKQADTRARLALKRGDLTRCEEMILDQLGQIRNSYMKLVHSEPARNGITNQVTAVITRTELDLEAAEADSNAATRTLQTIESNLNAARSNIRQLESKIEQMSRKILAELQANENTECTTVASAIAEAEMTIEIVRNDVATYKGTVDFYQGVLKSGKDKDICIGCNRKLPSREKAAFEEYCNTRIKEQPQKLADAESELEGWTEQLKMFKVLLPTEVALDRIRVTELPQARTAAEALELKLPDATARADAAATRTRELKTQLQEVQAVRRAAIEIERLDKGNLDTQSAIVSLENELRETGSIETTDDVQEQVTAVTNDIKAVKSAIEQRRSQLMLQTRQVQALVNSLHSMELDLSKKKEKLREKVALEKRRDDARTEATKLEATRLELDEKIRTAQAPARKLENDIAQARQEFMTSESIAVRQQAAFSKNLESLESNSKELKSYAATGVARRITECKAEITRCETAVKAVKGRIVALAAKISAADKKESESRTEIRNLKDNLRYRKEMAEVERIVAAIKDLDVAEAEKSARMYDARFEHDRKRLTEEQAKQSKLLGEIGIQKSTLTKQQQELQSEYKDIDQKYKIDLVRYKALQLATDDLEKYAKALDSAIMHFHGHKMEEINSTLKELWQKTYQGTDIDGIMIKSDAESKTAGGRSYNYRVVMAKDNVEMDMRGRCSAGQKVLASIIIRLALQESFSANCGILALDEPTTNLDAENIKALSSALSEIIAERRNQANFQLIVITHDEDFLQTLGSQGVLERYWRVARADNGKTSTILRQKLS